MKFTQDKQFDWSAGRVAVSGWIRAVLLLALFLPSVTSQAVSGQVTTTNDAGSHSLRTLIENSHGPSTITFAPALSGKTIVLTNGEIAINRDLTIDASALPEGIVIAGNGASRLFKVETGFKCEFRDLTLTNGILAGTDTNDVGAAVYNVGGRVTFNRCTIIGNACLSGAVYALGGIIILNDSCVASNQCNGVVSYLGDMSVSRCIISNNIGSGIVCVGTNLSVESSDVVSNAATSLAGAIFSQANTTITNCFISGNYGPGGAVEHFYGSLVIESSKISGNLLGGVVMYEESAAILRNVTLSENIGVSAGGFYSTSGLSNGRIILDNVTIVRNSGLEGGGICNESSFLTIVNCTIAENQAWYGGLPGAGWAAGAGGIYQIFGVTTVIHSTISSNNSAYGNGGIAVRAGLFNLENSICANNSGADPRSIVGRISSFQGNNLTNGNPKLAPLADYGGGMWTMPPLPGSPAIDAGVMTSNTPATDQRGAVRPSGPLPDLGAVEAFPFSTLILVDTDGDGIDDRLEPAYPQLTVGVNDHDLDTDGDGSPDWEELYNMTDPLDASSVFKILSFVPSNGFEPKTNAVFDVTLRTFPGLRYALETGDALTNLQRQASTSFTASNFTSTLSVHLGADTGFIRAIRAERLDP